jgi:hypothetical protein
MFSSIPVRVAVFQTVLDAKAPAGSTVAVAPATNEAKKSLRFIIILRYASLNDNENVRNCLNKNIYRGGGWRFGLDGGGVSGEMLGRVD